MSGCSPRPHSPRWSAHQRSPLRIITQLRELFAALHHVALQALPHSGHSAALQDLDAPARPVDHGHIVPQRRVFRRRRLVILCLEAKHASRGLDAASLVLRGAFGEGQVLGGDGHAAWKAQEERRIFGFFSLSLASGLGVALLARQIALQVYLPRHRANCGADSAASVELHVIFDEKNRNSLTNLSLYGNRDELSLHR
eukprot:scaffold764_cov248-Pinguiococcus_pyrenoidosus.AAC.16